MNIRDSAKTYRTHDCCNHAHNDNRLQNRIKIALHNTMHVFKGAWIFIIIGVAISSATLVFIPVDNLGQLIQSGFSVILAAIIGLPIHSDVFTILPILLLLKEMSTGVAISFALATMSISLPSVILLTRAFKGKFILLYTAILFLLSVIIGYIVIFLGL